MFVVWTNKFSFFLHIFGELQPKLKRAEPFPGDVVLRFAYEAECAVRSAAKGSCQDLAPLGQRVFCCFQGREQVDVFL